jgi:peptidoglycan-associated lipoprotein
MKRFIGLSLTFLFIFSGTLLLVSCAKKAVQTEPSMQTEQEMSEEGNSNAEEMEDQQTMGDKDIEEERLAAEEARMQAEEEASAARDKFASEDIYFDFDSAAILNSGQGILQEKAQYLNDNPDAVAVIEGHCDERGTDAYNLALGERRADAVKDYLVNLGIDPERMSTISYGEERPIDPSKTEAAWTKNRRAHLYIDTYR